MESPGNEFTTSLKVTESFGRQHKNVIHRLESLDCSDSFTDLNFKVSEYKDQNWDNNQNPGCNQHSEDKEIRQTAQACFEIDQKP